MTASMGTQSFHVRPKNNIIDRSMPGTSGSNCIVLPPMVQLLLFSEGNALAPSSRWDGGCSQDQARAPLFMRRRFVTEGGSKRRS
jgi:hypothetical protein